MPAVCGVIAVWEGMFREPEGWTEGLVWWSDSRMIKKTGEMKERKKNKFMKNKHANKIYEASEEIQLQDMNCPSLQTNTWTWKR